MLGDVANVPLEPPSIAEWEELLVRIEIAPRAVRATLHDAAPDDPEVRAELSRMVRGEIRWGHLLDALRQGAVIQTELTSVPDERHDCDTTDVLVRAFAELRSRNSAQAQRRGLDVWAWRSPTDRGDTLSAFRVLSVMARYDARHLAALREAAQSIPR